MLRRIFERLFIIAVVNCKLELLRFLEEVVNFELLDKVWVVVVPNHLGHTDSRLHYFATASHWLERVKNKKWV